MMKQVYTYFSYISPEHFEQEIFTFAFLDDKAKSQIKGYGIRFCKLEELTELMSKITQPFTLHTTLNRTDHRGRSSKNVQAARVLCVDIDEPIDRETLKSLVKELEIGMVVESSPGKFHLYWRLAGVAELSVWQKAQAAMAQRLIERGIFCDRSMSQLAKTIRVPGIERTLKDGSLYTPTVVYMDEEVELELGKQTWIEEYYKKAEAQVKEERVQLRKSIQHLKTPGARKICDFKGTLGRNQRLFLAIKYFVADLLIEDVEESTVLEFAQAVNSGFSEQLDESEFQQCFRSAYNKGLLARGRRQKKVDRMIIKTPPAHTNGYYPATKLSELSDYKPFAYDFNETLLRSDRFTELGMVARSIQRYGVNLVRINGDQVYGFSEVNKVWKAQVHNSPEVAYMVRTCAFDTVNDERFVPTLCMSDNGEPSVNKQIKMRDRFLGMRTQNMVISGVLASPYIEVKDWDIFDSEPTQLFCANGIIDFSCNEISPRAPVASDYALSKSKISFDSSKECPGWIEFLNQVFSETHGGSEDMVPFIQELFGYSISGSIEEQKIFCHCGNGSNGKSKVLQALNIIMGAYSAYVEPDELSKIKGTGKSFERFGAKIEGKRVCIIDDVDIGAVWNEGIVKSLTTNKIRARGEYEKTREITNRAKMHLGLNVVPEPEAENYGILRRLCFIPYERTFEPSGKKERELTAMLREEASGILNWAIEGFKRYWERGHLMYPEASTLATEEYKEDTFGVETLLREMFEVSSDEMEWYFLDELAKEIELYARGKGGPISITGKDLTHKFKTIFGSSRVKKLWNKDRNNAFRAANLKKLYKVQNSDIL